MCLGDFALYGQDMRTVRVSAQVIGLVQRKKQRKIPMPRRPSKRKAGSENKLSRIGVNIAQLICPCQISTNLCKEARFELYPGGHPHLVRYHSQHKGVFVPTEGRD
jgi:hypothetical protein